MPMRPTFDLELLRTLVFIIEEGSFTRAAERVGRTQSAVTLQMQKLEGLARLPLLERPRGGRVEPTAHGRILVDGARAMLKMNDDLFRAIGSGNPPPTLRLGNSASYAPSIIPSAVSALRAQYPDVLVELTEGNSCQLAPGVKDNAFDLVVSAREHIPPGWPATEVWRGRLRWITSIAHAPHLRDPVPLCLVPGKCPWLPAWLDECYWRACALRTLERAGRAHRVIASANTMEGLYAPVRAGEAITVSIGRELPEGLRVVGDDENLPCLPEFGIVILKAREALQPLTDTFAEIIASAFRFD